MLDFSLAIGICVFIIWIFGIDQGHANPRLDNLVVDHSVSPQTKGPTNYYLKRKGDDFSISYNLQQFESEQFLELARPETETISLAQFHFPANPKPQLARPVHFQQSSDLPGSTVDLYFDLDRTKLGDNLIQPIEKSIEVHEVAGEAPIYVEAYCDQRGGVGYSLALGARRIQLVKQYLLDLGISHRVIELVNYGSSRPPCGGATQRCKRAQFGIQSTFDFFAIQEPKFGCIVRIKLAENLTSSGKGGFPDPSLLSYHTRLAPLR